MSQHYAGFKQLFDARLIPCEDASNVTSAEFLTGLLENHQSINLPKI